MPCTCRCVNCINGDHGHCEHDCHYYDLDDEEMFGTQAEKEEDD